VDEKNTIILQKVCFLVANQPINRRPSAEPPETVNANSAVDAHWFSGLNPSGNRGPLKPHVRLKARVGSTVSPGSDQTMKASTSALESLRHCPFHCHPSFLRVALLRLYQYDVGSTIGDERRSQVGFNNWRRAPQARAPCLYRRTIHDFRHLMQPKSL
jgi:hypothetical protein